MLDVHLGGQRPAGMSFWPVPEDDPGVEVGRESIRLVTPDGALVRGLLWTPPIGTRWRTAVLLAHPRVDFSVHYACPLLAAAGYAVCAFATRYGGNDIDCLVEACAVDVEAVAHEMRRRGADAVVLLANAGGGALMGMANAERSVGDGWIGVAAHPGDGQFMLEAIDPSVADESDPFSVVKALDMYDSDNGWRPWPEPCTYDREWLVGYRAAQRARIARIDAIAKRSLAEAAEAKVRLRSVATDGDVRRWRQIRARSVHTTYLIVYRTLADPAYLDLSIDPDDRPLGSLSAHPDPLDANYGRAGLGRTVSARAWLSTWSGLSSPANLLDVMAKITVPTLLLHPTADTDVRRRHAEAMHAAAGADDKTFVPLPGAPHHLDGHRREAMATVAAWLAARYP